MKGFVSLLVGAALVAGGYQALGVDPCAGITADYPVVEINGECTILTPYEVTCDGDSVGFYNALGQFVGGGADPGLDQAYIDEIIAAILADSGEGPYVVVVCDPNPVP